MNLRDVVHSFGYAMQKKYGEKVHKITINAAFTCPNRDGSKGIGGCTFCNNASFNPHARAPLSVCEQISSGKQVIARRLGAKKYIAYFQAYTNTYADIHRLKALYDEALADNQVIGLSVGTRPDCVPDAVLALLADYQQRGFEVWLELGLQSAFNQTLDRVNRGHHFEDYANTVRRAKRYELQICTHLIIGLPGENADHSMVSLNRVMEEGVQGIKFHPLHVVKGTQLANQWRRGEYRALEFDDYIMQATNLVMHTPVDVIIHRLTATAEQRLLLAPEWCAHKWHVLNAIHEQLIATGAKQACKLT
ncbi:MAG: TIGR01212 family radical SAM protein [Gammaproteobacteria bacterium]|nr:MAG: TIGR01212 family radical SAM protein [Gammaproteobacteria bacterium]